jgi:hypothetical protein
VCAGEVAVYQLLPVKRLQYTRDSNGHIQILRQGFALFNVAFLQGFAFHIIQDKHGASANQELA